MENCTQLPHKLPHGKLYKTLLRVTTQENIFIKN